ncbi:phage regulatory protein/antirepressor Ant [Staphylococcus epidermidis]|uniref:phage antirepressor KilAC domain-containing protein n=1 Tax=Staphylococcus epidermidis TaxID=1282 RepID=UPI001FF012AA|nr:phage regulatory protein/antirepressor Ant [Staphylococcus epidermidis]MCG1679502.1 phage regulatory protein/antirepressor Ant [Staphylococcus epidermidis]MCG1734158.1 phage regulatory protein/antirepressor Ant [Staphylococcus epidermidis]MCG1743233.1 phage regulatory protein/antirepressor Ant [Staphylococcus epidermidis]MCG2170163.1 phage regulatory protein/antirepressor Ant [Staphylococcus epidermidis]MCG2313458.1 phage regulatory protein/antirepressor Ant [Staphylococcus epidermidis]
MQALQKIQIENNSEVGAVVSSRVIAQELEKKHAHVIRDLEKILLSPNVGSVIIPSEYKDSTGRKLKEYLLTKDGFTLYMFNIQGHNDFKMAYINKFNEMEKQLKQPVASYMIEDPVRRAEKWIEEQKEKEKLLEQNSIQQQQIGELKPKADYVDEILKSPGTMTITQIAADYGLSAQKLNKLLHQARLQRRVGKQWVLYIENMNRGYTKSHTIEIVRSYGHPDTQPQTRWTQKGRLKIHEIMTDFGYEAEVTEV